MPQQPFLAYAISLSSTAILAPSFTLLIAACDLSESYFFCLAFVILRQSEIKKKYLVYSFFIEKDSYFLSHSVHMSFYLHKLSETQMQFIHPVVKHT